MWKVFRSVIVVLTVLIPAWAGSAQAAGTLAPKGSPGQPIQIRDHELTVTILAGFARVEVQQTFFNPNDQDLEAIYSFPVPKSGSLSEYSVTSGETRIDGEVVTKDKANTIYEEEKKQGNDAGVANKNSYQTFEFKIARVAAKAETRMRFVYYQPLRIDTGIGRFVYPLEDGGTDDAAASFWAPNAKVENSFAAHIGIQTDYPIDEVRVPGFESAAVVTKKGAGEFQIELSTQAGTLNRDLVVYYRLVENRPAGIELIPYRADPAKPGTFMLVTTPGVDLKPLDEGADYVFVLDVSGSMQGKLPMLVAGVVKALGGLHETDRFRIVTFNEAGREATRGWTPATGDNVRQISAALEQLRANGGTNIYSGLETAFRALDSDRVTTVLLVTDGVTNTGVIDPKAFAVLVKQYDVRLFGFLLGNSANWPLMEVITKASGGFYAAVSNADDIMGQLLLAKSKIRFEALHHADLRVDGVKVFDTTDTTLPKIYRGEQVVLFGRYENAGEATVTLHAALSGQDKEYRTKVTFPETSVDHPEIERLWAMSQIEAVQHREQMGDLESSEAKHAISDLGVAYQLVTDETSMVVLSDAGFSRYGIDRSNKARVTAEDQARSAAASRPVQSYRQSAQPPMFPSSASSLPSRSSSGSGSGGGAIDPVSAALLAGPIGVCLFGRRRRPRSARSSEQEADRR